MKAYVLVETSAGKTKAVKRALQKVKPGKCKVESLDAVTGPFDYIAVVEGPTLDDIGQLVTDGIGAIDPEAWDRTVEISQETKNAEGATVLTAAPDAK